MRAPSNEIACDGDCRHRKRAKMLINKESRLRKREHASGCALQIGPGLGEERRDGVERLLL